MSRPTLGLAVIAKNEVENIRQLTGSIKGCFDQMILVDTGSTDGTIELAKELGWTVEHFKWVDDFSAARNYAFSKLTTEYAMWLDLDDTLDNPEKFIFWRDNLMSAADQWFATYHYASDVKGTPLCSFARERVVRLSKGFKWQYFLHEGIVPINPRAKIGIQFATSWSVKHMRTLEDLAQDRSRNLRIFDKHKDNLNPRMQFYYGKELYETGRHVEAVPWLLKAICEKDLELHDRVLAIQYACYSYLKSNQVEQAIHLAHKGLEIDPNRAEFWQILGDCYITTNRLQLSIPFYSAAKSCVLTNNAGANQTGAIFVTEATYTTAPRNQLARAYANLQQIDRAEKEAQETIDLYNDHEAKTILSEIVRLKSSNIIKTSGQTEVDEIVFTCPPGSLYEFDEDVYKKRGIGGSETALVEMAHQLALLTGKPVKVFTLRKEQPEKVFPAGSGSVSYLSFDGVVKYFSEWKPSTHIAWRHNLPLTKARTFVWSHDLTAFNIQTSALYEKVLALTPFHSAFLQGMVGLSPDKIHVTRNGLNLEKFKGLEATKKNPDKVIYSSSPDRGLDRAIAVMDIVRKSLPTAELHCFYGFDNMKKMGALAEAERLERMIHARPWVKFHGNIQQNELMRHMSESSVWLYPTNFLETSCITAMEALACRTYPVVRKFGGLQDTLAHAESLGMASLVDNFAESVADHEIFAKEVISAIEEKKCDKMDYPMTNMDWQSVAKEWIEELKL